jgi:protein-S-isoprenylcysteine O-methyltransferase Ste14
MTISEKVFKYRFWFFALIFWVGFSLYGVDRVPAGVALLRVLAPSVNVDTPAGRLYAQLVFGGGAALVVLAALIRTWATAYLHTNVVHDSKLHSEALVASGPYRYVRNPLYLGGALVAFGFALIASRLGAAVMIVGIIALELTLIHAEERLLAAAHPESFAAYRAQVPRLVPSLLPRVPPSSAKPEWGQALAGEAMFWTFAAGTIAFAITLNQWWMIGVGVSGFVFHVFIIPQLMRRFRPGRSP